MAEDQQNPNVEQEVTETITLDKPAEAETEETNVKSVTSENAPENIQNDTPESTEEVDTKPDVTETAEEKSDPPAQDADVPEDVTGEDASAEDKPAEAATETGSGEKIEEEDAVAPEASDESSKSTDAQETEETETDEQSAAEDTVDIPDAATESVDAATESVDAATTESADAATESPDFEDAADPDEPEPAVVLPEGMIGFTGKLTGDVVKLEDLDRTEDPEDDTIGLEDLRSLIESTLTHVSEHEIVSGKIVSIGEKDVVIDIGFKSDGIVSRGEFEGELSVGDEVEVFLERIEDYHGQLVLSKTKADTVRRWRRIESAYENEEIIEGTIVRRIKGGMIVELFDEMEAFLPGSQIDVRPVRDFDAYLDKRMEFKIVKLNPINENIVVSHKALIEKDLQEQRQTILASMEPGQILEGSVKNITDFGVFIDLGGVDGLLHITDLSWGRVSHPSELVSLDEQLNVVVLDYDKERQRISLGLKQLQPHPWDSIEEKFARESVVEGKVVSITDYGAFVELEKGIEGLVHISEMSWTEHIRHPSQMVSLGQLVPVKILNIDTEGKKISLGMKQLEPDPWENIAERYPPGTVMHGKVRNITNFGVFVEIEPGIDGLVHISDLSWTKRIRHPSEMVKKGLELDVVVLNIDTSDRRISLGHKQVDTNPWSQFSQVYAEGERSEAKVVRHEDKGIIVELPMEVEAFIPTGELRNPSQLAQSYPIEHKLEELLVIRFSPGKKEIILSEIASEKVKEREEKQAEVREKRQVRQKEQKEISRYRKKAASSGPTTLGELSGLADLKAKLMAEESVVEPEPEVKEEAPVEPEPEVKEEAPVEPEPEVKAEAPVEPEPEVKAEAPAEPEAEAPAEPEADKKPAKATRKKATLKAKKTTKAEAKPKAKPKTKPKTEAKPKTKAKPKTEAKPKAKPKAKAPETSTRKSKSDDSKEKADEDA